MAPNRQADAVSSGAAMGLRGGGLVVNTMLNGIAGARGWALGGLLSSRGGFESDRCP